MGKKLLSNRSFDGDDSDSSDEELELDRELQAVAAIEREKSASGSSSSSGGGDNRERTYNKEGLLQALSEMGTSTLPFLETHAIGEVSLQLNEKGGELDDLEREVRTLSCVCEL